MHPIPKKYFGPTGIKCIFAINSLGDTDVGYITKQVGLKQYEVTNGSITKICTLSTIQITDPTHLNPGECAVLVAPDSGATQCVIKLNTFNCVTSTGNSYQWTTTTTTTTAATSNSNSQIIKPLIPPQALTTLELLTGGTSHAQAAACSADGSIIVGYDYDSSGYSHAVKWTNGVISDLGFLPSGATVSNATACSADGSIIVGSANDSGNNARAVKWVNGVISDLGTLPGDTTAKAMACSADGSIIVGISGNNAAKWVNGVVYDLGQLYSGSATYAMGCSNDGSIIVGYANDSNFNTHAVKWTNDVISDLGTLPGGYTGYSSGCSEDGLVIVGFSDSSAVKWVNGVISELPTPSGFKQANAKACSADGSVIVGTVSLTSNHLRPVAWANGDTAYELPMLPGSTSTDDGLAIYISGDESTIVGASGVNGTDHQTTWTR